MPNSHNWSSASASSETACCRIDWRPSRILCGALIAFGLLAGLSLLASDLRPLFAWPAAMAAVGWGAWLARRERRRAPIRLTWRADGLLFVDGERVQHPRLQWRGPLAFLDWREGGKARRLAWWPDILPAAQGRELRLAAMAADAAHSRSRMAP